MASVDEIRAKLEAAQQHMETTHVMCMAASDAVAWALGIVVEVTRGSLHGNPEHVQGLLGRARSDLDEMVRAVAHAQEELRVYARSL